MTDDIFPDKNKVVADVIVPSREQKQPEPPPAVSEKSSAVWKFFSLRSENRESDESLTATANGSRQKSRLGIRLWIGAGALIFSLVGFTLAKTDLEHRVKFLWLSFVASRNSSAVDSGYYGNFSGKPENGQMDGLVADIVPVWQSGLDTLEQFKSIISLSADLTGEAGWLANNGIRQFFAGGELCSHLSKVRDYLSQAEDKTGLIAGNKIGIADSKSLLPFRISINRTGQFLDVLMGWLNGDRHVVILLQNNSELRPTGGFVGGYVDASIKNCVLESPVFRDVNEVDRGLPVDILPPRPVQAIAKTLKVADANWFENFPESAGLITELMNSSDLYQNPAKPVDAVVAITPRVVGDILSVLGPVKLSDGKIITEDDFLTEFQAEVQSGQAEKDPKPKQVLEDALSSLIRKLKDASGGETAQSLLSMMPEWISRRDVAVYVSDKNMENFVDSAQMSGRLFDLPTDWNGSYLSVVAANLGGGKSDLYMADKINAQVQLDLNGVWSTHLILASKHNGDKSKDWWYKERSERFVRILVPKGAKLTHSEGVWVRDASTYKTSPKDSLKNQTISAWEDGRVADDANPGVFSYAESGRTAFGFWTKTEAGKSSQVALDYSEQAYAKPVSGTVYHFMLERQPGWPASYDLEISAPPGFAWSENNSPLYKISWDDSSPARNSVELTLEKI